jgi:fructose-1-phosphate kinase PfkB-like protein
MLAGLAYGLARDIPLLEAVKIGVAAGTANTLVIGAGQFTQDDYEEVLAAIEIVPI